MRPKMKYSRSKTSSEKLNSTTNKALVQSCKLRRSQQKTKEICHVYYMRLRSGLTIRKEACYFDREATKICSLKSGRKHKENFSAYSKDAPRSSQFVEYTPSQSCDTSDIQAYTPPQPRDTRSIQESCASLSTYDDQSVNFVLENGCYVINVEDSGRDQGKDKVLLRYYESPFSASQSGDSVDGKMLMVNMSPMKDTGICLHANDKDNSVELQKGQVPLSEQAFFVLHKKAYDYVSFECKNHRGTFIGVKDNQLALMEENSTSNNNIMFKLSKV